MTSLARLIEKLEAASEGSRELDLWISHLAGKHGSTFHHNEAFERIQRGRKLLDMKWLPHYTTSLDTALSLVPEGKLWTVSNYNGFGQCEAWFDDGDFCHPAATPALALCIAALKTRAALADKS